MARKNRVQPVSVEAAKTHPTWAQFVSIGASVFTVLVGGILAVYFRAEDKIKTAFESQTKSLAETIGSSEQRVISKLSEQHGDLALSAMVQVGQNALSACSAAVDRAEMSLLLADQRLSDVLYNTKNGAACWCPVTVGQAPQQWTTVVLQTVSPDTAESLDVGAKARISDAGDSFRRTLGAIADARDVISESNKTVSENLARKGGSALESVRRSLGRDERSLREVESSANRGLDRLNALLPQSMRFEKTAIR